MKLSHLATVAVLTLSTATSFWAIGIVAKGLKLEQTAVPVVAGTALVGRMQGLSDAIEYLPPNAQGAVLRDYGFRDRTSFDAAYESPRLELQSAERARSEELEGNDKRLTALLLAFAFSGCVAAMGALVLFNNALAKSRASASAEA